MSSQAITVATSETRYAFGKNWQGFLNYLDEARILEAEKSLCTMLQVDSLRGKSFLDVGSGSGLFSLAALRLGADRVHSFDYDPQSVACAEELKRRYYPGATHWTVQQGSALDAEYLADLGTFDIVYSWGVLHHTGNMWQALGNVASCVKPPGILFIALYNDQGVKSRVWAKIKVLYNRSRICRFLMVPAFIGGFALLGGVNDLFFRGKNPLARYRQYRNLRGMAFVPDVLDWLGGYPFEVAKPDDVLDFYHSRGFQLTKLKTVGGKLGNNEYVFQLCAG